MALTNQMLYALPKQYTVKYKITDIEFKKIYTYFIKLAFPFKDSQFITVF